MHYPSRRNIRGRLDTRYVPLLLILRVPANEALAAVARWDNREDEGGRTEDTYSVRVETPSFPGSSRAGGPRGKMNCIRVCKLSKSTQRKAEDCTRFS